MSDAPNTLSAIRSGLIEALGAIERANRAIADGHRVDLADTVRRLDGLCEAALALPREDGRLLEPQLHDLIVGLNQIADALRRARAAGSTGGDAPADHRAASLAYRGSKD